MANPDVTFTPPSGVVPPGAPIQCTWVAVDADNASYSGEWSGHDSQGNVKQGTFTLNVQDDFTMDYVKVNGVNLLIDNANRKATGVAPTAP